MVDVELTEKEYAEVLKWYSMAFGKLDPKMIKDKDKKLKSKLEVMKEAEEYLNREESEDTKDV
jgi:hypothetical protein